MKLSNVNKCFVSYTRVCAMFFVIFTHICQESYFSLVIASAQFFITGVTIFIILTGYLYGEKAIYETYPKSILTWIIHRFVRILIPYYIAVLMITTLKKVWEVKVFFMFFFCLQDYMPDLFYNIGGGVGHLWYLTMLVPLNITIAIILKKRKFFKKYFISILSVLFILQITVTYLINPKVGRYIFYVMICVIAFYFANKKNITYTIKHFIYFTILTTIAWGIRLGLYVNGCETYLYNNLYTYYTQALMSVWIISLFYFCCMYKILRPNKIIFKLDSISYEVFLMHYIFIQDTPFKIYGRLNNFILESVLVIFLSILSGSILSFISKLILNLLFNYKRKVKE